MPDWPTKNTFTRTLLELKHSQTKKVKLNITSFVYCKIWSEDPTSIKLYQGQNGNKNDGQVKFLVKTFDEKAIKYNCYDVSSLNDHISDALKWKFFKYTTFNCEQK